MFFADSETEAGELYNGGNGRNDEDEESSVPEDDVENKDEEEDDMDVCSADREDEDDDMADAENGAEAIMPEYRKDEDPEGLSGFARTIFDCWKKRMPALNHETSCAAWQLSVNLAVREDVRKRCVAEHKEILQRVVFRLHIAPCPNDKVDPTTGKKVSELNEEELWGIFLDELHQFRTQSGIYGKKSIWNDECVRLGKSHLWHRRHSDMTLCLGFVARRVCGKLNGIGVNERVWGGVKSVKHGKASHMKAKSTKKRSVIYVSSLMDKARIDRQHRIAQNVECEFNMHDLDFNAGLLKQGVVVEDLQRAPPKRLFRAYVEPWEEEARIRKKTDCEDMIARKYGGMKFRDPQDGKVLKVFGGNCEWINKRKRDPEGETWGWHVLCYPQGEDPEVMSGLEPFDLELVHEHVKGYEQEENIMIIDRPHGVEE